MTLLPVTSAETLCGAPGTAQLDGADGVATARGDGLVSPLPPLAHPTAHVAAATAIHVFTSRTTAAQLLHANVHTDIRPTIGRREMRGKAHAAALQCRARFAQP
jgi:hypothetical protein